MKSAVLFYIPDMYARRVFFLTRVDFFPSTFSVMFTRALCTRPDVHLYSFGKFGHEQLGVCGLWFLSFFEHAAWSGMAQVLLLCLRSHALVVTCPAWGWSQAAVLHHHHVHHELQQQQQAWLLQQAKSAHIYRLEWPRSRFWVVAYTARLGWTFTPNISILLLKEGSTMMLLAVQPAFIVCTSIHLFTVTSALARNYCFVRCFS